MHGARTNISPADIARYREDGFLVIDDFVDTAGVELLRRRLSLVLDGNFDLVCEPDDYHWKAGRDRADVTRSMGPVWRCDSALARFTLTSGHAGIVAALEGMPSVRLYNDYVWLKPEGGKPLEMHQDAAYNTWLQPPHIAACWIALDDTYADGGTLFYVRGSHQWGAMPPELVAPPPIGGEIDEDYWTAHLRRFAPPGANIELVPLEVRAGTAAFHSGWTWHGSGSNEREGSIRRSYTAHFLNGSARQHPTVRDPIFSRPNQTGAGELDERSFPILWALDGSRSEWIDPYLGALGSFTNAERPEVAQVIDFSAIETRPWTVLGD